MAITRVQHVVDGPIPSEMGFDIAFAAPATAGSLILLALTRPNAIEPVFADAGFVELARWVGGDGSARHYLVARRAVGGEQTVDVGVGGTQAWKLGYMAEYAPGSAAWPLVIADALVASTATGPTAPPFVTCSATPVITPDPDETLFFAFGSALGMSGGDVGLPIAWSAPFSNLDASGTDANFNQWRAADRVVVAGAAQSAELCRQTNIAESGWGLGLFALQGAAAGAPSVWPGFF